MLPGYFADYIKMQKAQLTVLKQKRETYFSFNLNGSFFLLYVSLCIYYRDGYRTLNTDQHEFNSYKFKTIIGARTVLFRSRGESYLRVVLKYIANQFTASASVT